MGGLFSSPKPSAPPPPPPPEPVTMPEADDEAVQKAKRRKLAEIQARSGRASTILTDNGGAAPSEKLGG